MDEVIVSPAGADERGVIANMMQLYIHDFSEFWRGGPLGELGPDGRFGDYPLDPYWQDAGYDPLLIRAGGQLAGFALINGVSHSGDPLDRNVGEFFVARKHRRGGVGQAAARAIFSRWPGRWEAAVARRNTGALGFWRHAVGGHPDLAELCERDVTDTRWDGTILQFRIAEPRP